MVIGDKLRSQKESRDLLPAPRSKSWVRIQGGPILACIDMGTNSFHMIVCQASAQRDHFEVITRVRESVPSIRNALGEHYIDADANRFAIRILREMKFKAQEKGATAVIAVATSAVREAKNGEAVLSKVRQELDIDAKMISGKEEARLIYLGVLWNLPNLAGPFGIVDVGGGSTEIVIGDRRQRLFSESYKLGAARLTQRFFAKGRPSVESIKALHNEVRGVLRPAAQKIAQLGGVKELIGTSGTIQALAKLDRRQTGNLQADLAGYKLPIDRLDKIVSQLEESGLAGERLEGVSLDRGQTLLAGSIVVLETLLSLRVDSISICTAALREGVVVDRFLQTGWLNCGLDEHKDPRSDSVHILLDKYHASVEHAEQVARLAAEIFRQSFGLLHQYGEDAGHLLWSAGMLHDVGSFIGRNGHHKHSYYLIKNGGLLGHSEEEVNLIACIARYHRGSLPKESHESFRLVPNESRRLVADMAAILRLAEALDRSHCQVIENVKLAIEPQAKGKSTRRPLSIHAVVRHGKNCQPELWALQEKKLFFEQQFDVQVEFKQVMQDDYLTDMSHVMPPI